MHSRDIATMGPCILDPAHSGCMTAVAAFQPENVGGETIVLVTTDADGESHERVLSPIDDAGRLFVAANHWPRAWYHRAFEHLDVSVTRNGETTDYRAVPVSEEERERLLDESDFSLVAYAGRTRRRCRRRCRRRWRRRACRPPKSCDLAGGRASARCVRRAGAATRPIPGPPRSRPREPDRSSAGAAATCGRGRARCELHPGST